MKKLLMSTVCATALLGAAPASAHLLPGNACVTPAQLVNIHCWPNHIINPPANPPPAAGSSGKPALIPKRPANALHNIMKGVHQGVFVCVGSVVVAAMHANATQNRELTGEEARSCGLTYWAGGWRLNRFQAGSNIGEVTTCHGSHYKQPGARYCGS